MDKKIIYIALGLFIIALVVVLAGIYRFNFTNHDIYVDDGNGDVLKYAEVQSTTSASVQKNINELTNEKNTTIQKPTPLPSKLTPTPVTPPVVKNGCTVGGCSGQLCGDGSIDGLISTCEYREEYACYKSAQCERQTNGQCGWTETPELTECLLLRHSTTGFEVQ